MSDIKDFGAQTHYAIPPESTGANIAHRQYYVGTVTGLTKDQISVGDNLITSNNAHCIAMEAYDIGSGEIRLTFAISVSSTAHSISTGTITIEGTETGTLESVSAIMIPAVTLTDPWNANRELRINRSGAASMTFTEGEPQLDAFGLLRMSSPTALGSYKFTDNFSVGDFATETAGTGTIARDATTSTYNLDVGANSGDSAIATTNNYHKYYTGFSTQVLISSFSGDDGKENVIRRWGYFDEEDGVFFEQDGNNLYIVLRTFTSGTVEETRILQEDFNQDVLDGTESEVNPSGFNLNLSANNLFYFDFSWLGSGSIRAGIYDEVGHRVVAHSFVDTSNISPNPFWRNPNLPLRFEIYNTAATSSPSRYSLICAGVSTDALNESDEFSTETTLNNVVTTSADTVSDTETPLLAMRVASLLHGERNRRKIVPFRINTHVSGDHSILLLVRFGSILDNPTWTPVGQSSGVEIVESPVVTTPGTQIGHFFLDPGSDRIDVSEFFNSYNNFFSASALGDPSDVLTFTAICLTTGQTVDVRVGANWVEL